MKILRGLGIGVMALVLFACGSDDGPSEADSQLVLYKVNYDNLEFEGGITLAFTQLAGPVFDEIPVEISIEDPEPGEDGSIVLTHAPSQDRIFQGALTTNGQADITFPFFIPAADFLVLDTPFSLPAGTNVQSINGNYSQAEFDAVWGAVSRLGLNDFILDETTLVGLFLYQPNTNSNTSGNWDWILLLYRQ